MEDREGESDRKSIASSSFSSENANQGEPSKDCSIVGLVSIPYISNFSSKSQIRRLDFDLFQDRAQIFKLSIKFDSDILPNIAWIRHKT
jgi:hypothetical protein